MGWCCYFGARLSCFKLVFSPINGAQFDLLHGCKLWVWFLLCFSLFSSYFNADGNIWSSPSPVSWLRLKGNWFQLCSFLIEFGLNWFYCLAAYECMPGLVNGFWLSRVLVMMMIEWFIIACSSNLIDDDKVVDGVRLIWASFECFDCLCLVDDVYCLNFGSYWIIRLLDLDCWYGDWIVISDSRF